MIRILCCWIYLHIDVLLFAGILLGLVFLLALINRCDWEVYLNKLSKKEMLLLLVCVELFCLPVSFYLGTLLCGWMKVSLDMFFVFVYFLILVLAVLKIYGVFHYWEKLHQNK